MALFLLSFINQGTFILLCQELLKVPLEFLYQQAKLQPKELPPIFLALSALSQAHKHTTSIYGIVPTDQDVLAKNYFFSENIKEGDKVLITNVGAYTLTFSNRFPYLLPKIFLISKNKVKTLFDPKINHDFSLKLT